MSESGRPVVAVLDYGIGNLRSAQKGLERAGADDLVLELPVQQPDAEVPVIELYVADGR